MTLARYVAQVTPSWRVLIDRQAHHAQLEIRRMAESARRSIGQQYRYHMKALGREK